MFADVHFPTCSLCSLVSFLARCLLQKEAEDYEEACGEEEAPVDDGLVPPPEDQGWDGWYGWYGYGGGYGGWDSATDPTKEENAEAEEQEEEMEEEQVEEQEKEMVEVEPEEEQAEEQEEEMEEEQVEEQEKEMVEVEPEEEQAEEQEEEMEEEQVEEQEKEMVEVEPEEEQVEEQEKEPLGGQHEEAVEVQQEEEQMEVEQEEEKMEVEQDEEKMKVEEKVEEKKKPSPTRRHSVKRPPSPSLGLTDVPPFEKKDIPVKWGPIKNASAALSIFKKSQGHEEKDYTKEETGEARVSWWDDNYINMIEDMTVAEKIRVVMEFTSMSRLLNWRPPQLSESTWASLTDIANLVFNYGLVDSAEIVRYLKQSATLDFPSLSLKGLSTLRDMNMEQCTKLAHWLNGQDDRETFERIGQKSMFYRTMLEEAHWPEVLAVRSLIWDYWLESPQLIFKYIRGESWETFVKWFRRVLDKQAQVRALPVLKSTCLKRYVFPICSREHLLFAALHLLFVRKLLVMIVRRIRPHLPAVR